MGEKALPQIGPEPPPDDLPPGFGFEFDPAVARFDGGAVVVGGVPERVVRLTARARRVLERDAGPVPADTATTRAVRQLLDAGILHPRPVPGGFGATDVTIVVPVHDREKALERVLSGLGTGSPIVVADDESTDGSADVAASSGAAVVRRSERGGPAAARNSGLEVVQTPLVAFVDSDCRLPDGWLEPLLAHFTDPTVAVVAPRVVGDVTEREDPFATYETVRSPQDLGRHAGYVRPGARVSFLPAAVMVARADVVRGFGGFDEALEVGEDVDFVWRLVAAGWRVRYEPGVVAFHEARPDLRRFLRRRVDYGTSAAALHRRHPGDVAPIGISPWSIAVWGAALCGLPRTALALAGATIVRLAAKLRGRVSQQFGVAWRVAGRGHAGAVRILAYTMVRTWLPLAVIVMVCFRRTRPALGSLIVLAPLAEWLERRPPLDPVRYSVLHLADDAAYCAGVWIGCLRHQTAGPLLPRLFRPVPMAAGRTGSIDGDA